MNVNSSDAVVGFEFPGLADGGDPSSLFQFMQAQRRPISQLKDAEAEKVYELGANLFKEVIREELPWLSAASAKGLSEAEKRFYGAHFVKGHDVQIGRDQKLEEVDRKESVESAYGYQLTNRKQVEWACLLKTPAIQGMIRSRYLWKKIKTFGFDAPTNAFMNVVVEATSPDPKLRPSLRELERRISLLDKGAVDTATVKAVASMVQTS